MSSDLVTIDRKNLIKILQNSLYPGAAEPSIELVLSYCKARKLDPMLKPVHIVPMWDSKAGQNRDTILPGISLYRTMAEESGQHIGTSSPVFGADVTRNLGGQEITFPEWCEITVKKLMAGDRIAEFTVREYWLENYAKKGGKERSIAPNSMWSTRVRGQIAKCAEAQALRRAFPNHMSKAGEYTAEEMEGKTIDSPSIESVRPSAFVMNYPDEKFENNFPTWKRAIESGAKSASEIVSMVSTKGVLSEAQVARIRAVSPIQTQGQQAEVTDAVVKKKSSVDQETGEVLETFTYAQIADKIEKAKSAQDLDFARTMTGQLDKPQFKDELLERIDIRGAAFEDRDF